MALSALWRPRSRKLESVSCSGKPGPDRPHPCGHALGDHLPQQPLLRAEVVEEPRRRHPDPIGQRGDPGAAVPLGREQFDSGLNDLLPPQVAPGLAAVLVRPGGLPVTDARVRGGAPVLLPAHRGDRPSGHWTRTPRSASKASRPWPATRLRSDRGSGRKRPAAPDGHSCGTECLATSIRLGPVGTLAAGANFSYSSQKSHSRHIRVRVRGQRIGGCQSVG